MLISANPHLALAFANTRYWRGSAVPTDELSDASALLDWLEKNGMARPDGPQRATLVFDEAVALREVLYRVLAAQAQPGDIAALQAAIAAAPMRNRLGQTTDGFAWQLDDNAKSLPALLAPVLWSAGDLLTGDTARRLRLCSNDRCLYLFIDNSRSNARRWCDMKACGNRAKAHRHYLRSRVAE